MSHAEIEQIRKHLNTIRHLADEIEAKLPEKPAAATDTGSDGPGPK